MTMNDQQIQHRITQYHEQATAITGLDDFGPDDGYLEALSVFISAVDRECELTEFGEQSLLGIILGGLIGRLSAQQGFKEHPGCLDQRIKKPIIITGLPRSGTTALHKLLSSVGKTQALEYWLAETPMVRPPREQWPEIPAYNKTVAQLDALFALVPQARAMHEMDANDPDECRLILAHSFKTYALSGYFRIPSYTEWLKTTSHAAAYNRYRQVLQLIGYNNSNQWILKDPMHLAQVDCLMEQFPDACIVNIYREPADAMPSVCSLMYTIASASQTNLDKKMIGPMIVDDYAWQLDQYLALRENIAPARFLDVQFDDLVANPVQLALDIYKHFDFDVDATGKAELENWCQNNKKGKHGKHEYSLEEFGISADYINERFSAYRQRNS